jgi:hypothetical protein
MTEDERKVLVARPSAAVGKISAGAESALSPISSDALVLAGFSASSLVSARFRVGDYAFREADYLQILLWAKTLESSPEKIIETLQNTSFDYSVGPSGDRQLISLKVEKGSITSLVWDNRLLPLTDFLWVNDLKSDQPPQTSFIR